MSTPTAEDRHRAERFVREKLSGLAMAYTIEEAVSAVSQLIADVRASENHRVNRNVDDWVASILV